LVRGGKSHELLLSVVGMLASQACQAGDRVAVDADEAAGLPGAVALGEVVQHRVCLVVGKMGAEQRGALAFGEARAASLAVEEADMSCLPKRPQTVRLPALR
jgi:hypothetical protein